MLLGEVMVRWALKRKGTHSLEDVFILYLENFYFKIFTLLGDIFLDYS